jgi:hypothetical protein
MKISILKIDYKNLNFFYFILMNIKSNLILINIYYIIILVAINNSI